MNWGYRSILYGQATRDRRWRSGVNLPKFALFAVPHRARDLHPRGESGHRSSFYHRRIQLLSGGRLLTRDFLNRYSPISSFPPFDTPHPLPLLRLQRLGYLLSHPNVRVFIPSTSVCMQQI